MPRVYASIYREILEKFLFETGWVDEGGVQLTRITDVPELPTVKQIKYLHHHHSITAQFTKDNLLTYAAVISKDEQIWTGLKARSEAVTIKLFKSRLEDYINSKWSLPFEDFYNSST